jgi:hypothetical protein
MNRILPWILAAAGWVTAAYQSIRLFAATDEIRLLRANARLCPEREQPSRKWETMPANSVETGGDSPDRA